MRRFKVWNTLENKFLESGDECKFDVLTGEIIHTSCLNGDKCGHLSLFTDSGILDKNGNLIFEGDIIKEVWHDTSGTGYIRLWMVRYNYKSGLFEGVSDLTSNYSGKRITVKEVKKSNIEVVGHICTDTCTDIYESYKDK